MRPIIRVVLLLLALLLVTPISSHAALLTDLAPTPINNGVLLAASPTAWWTLTTTTEEVLSGGMYQTGTPPPGAFVCPAGFRCGVNQFGWSVLVEHSVSITPGTGSLGLDGSTSPVVSVPELSILRSFTKRLGGQKFNDLVNPTLQRVTAWGAAKLLGAKSIGVYVVLPTKILEVQEWCSGVASMKWLMLLALGLGLVCRMSLPWTALFIVAAAMISLEANVVRVAAIGVGFAKDWTAWGAMAFGAAQVVGLGWLACRRSAC